MFAMSATDKVFTGSIPEFYDTYLVPLIFESYAEDLATRISDRRPGTVLEIAAGSGVVTRALAKKLPEHGRYVVTDLNQSMLDYAEEKQGPDERITWKQADALELPFDDGSFDTVCCQFGIMFFPDRIAGYAEAKRVLSSGGAFVFSVWDRIENNEFAAAVTDAASEVFPDNPPLFLARTPHGHHDIGVIKDEVMEAGFTGVDVVTVTETSTAPSPRHPAIAYCQGTPLRNEIESRDPGLLDHVTEMAAQKIEELYGGGEVSAKIQGYVVIATVD